ncbi:MAG TPA: helix-turn-helix domain-containing protein [Solirubrobacteraceae bacterium]|nr:helix-turn-helix domain-containing protein [Solirubrobacteraceae bacterium]
MSEPAALRILLDDETVERLAAGIAQRLGLPASSISITDSDRWLSSREAAGHLGITLAALHRLTAARRVPFAQDAPGCRCWFRRSELDAWRRQGARNAR